jgi:hypothetical protein
MTMYRYQIQTIIYYIITFRESVNVYLVYFKIYVQHGSLQYREISFSQFE